MSCFIYFWMWYLPFPFSTHLYWTTLFDSKSQFSWFTLEDKTKFSQLINSSTWLELGTINSAIYWFWLLVRPISGRKNLMDIVIHVIHLKHTIASLWRVFILYSFLFFLKNVMFLFKLFWRIFPIPNKLLLLEIEARLWEFLIYRSEKIWKCD